MTKTHILQSGLCLSIVSLALAGCGKPATAPAAASPPTSAMARTPAAAHTSGSITANSALLAAGEPFENLTEQALTAPLTTLDGLIVKAKGAAQTVRSYLPTDAAGQLDAKLGEIEVARQANQRTDLALASVEVYRIMVSAVTSPVRTPTQVNMLDYAGFRYNADLMATPSRWNDMVQAIAVARDN